MCCSFYLVGCKQKRIMHKNTTVISTMKEKEEGKKTPKEWYENS